MAAITDNASKLMVNWEAGNPKTSRQRVRRSLSAKRGRRSTRHIQSDNRVDVTPGAVDGHEGEPGTMDEMGEYLSDTLSLASLSMYGQSSSCHAGALDVSLSSDTELNHFDESDAPAKEPNTNFLAMYFREMAALDVLRPEEEFSQAKKIEELEISVWEEVLGFAPLVDHVLKTVEACMASALVESRALRRAATEARKSNTRAAQARLAKAARKCAEKLRAIDTDRDYLEAVFRELVRVEQGTRDAHVTRRLGSLADELGLVEYMARARTAERHAASARNDFVKANLRLVVSIARRFNHGRMALADLIQEGNIGLMKAVERFDYRRGFRFSTYASWWIRHAISRALADKGREIRLPVHMVDTHQRIAKAKRELMAQLGRQPTNDEIAATTQIPVEKIEKMRTYLLDQSVSLDRPANDEEGRTFVEFLQDPEFEENSMTDILALQALTAELRRALLELKPIEADILRQRFGLDDDCELTLKQIGEKYNLSRERIRQLQEQAMTKVRRALQRKEAM